MQQVSNKQIISNNLLFRKEISNDRYLKKNISSDECMRQILYTIWNLNEKWAIQSKVFHLKM